MCKLKNHKTFLSKAFMMTVINVSNTLLDSNNVCILIIINENKSILWCIVKIQCTFINFPSLLLA